MKKILCCFSGFLMMFVCALPWPGGAQMYTEWVTGVGGSGFDRAVAVDTDDSGNVYTTGYFMDRVDFNPGTAPGDTLFITASSWVDLFLLKQDAAGNFVWVRNMGGFAASYDASKIMVSDAAGYTYVAGGFEGTADFGAGNSAFNLSSNGDADIFIFKMDPAGNLVWSRSIGSDARDCALSLALDTQGHVHITGFFNKKVDFNPGTNPADTFFLTAKSTSNNRSSIFVLKLDTAGNFKWAKDMGASGNSANRGQSIAADMQGNVYVTGTFQGTVDMDPSPLPADTFTLRAMGGGSLIPGVDIFILKLDSAGKFDWAKSFANMDNNNFSWYVSVDHSGNVYTTGGFFGKLDFDPGNGAADTFYLTPQAGKDIFISKLNAAGDFVWAKSVPCKGGDDEGRSIFTDAIGNVYLTGNFSDTAYLINPGTDTIMMVPWGTDEDIFLAKLDAAGNFLWAQNPRGAGHDYGCDVITDRSGNVYVAGAIAQSVLFDQSLPPVNSNGGDFDSFTWKLGCGDTSSSQVVITGACPEYIYNGIAYTASGTYKQVFPNAAGCDSTIILILTLVAEKPVIDVDEYELTTTQPYAGYQWLRNDTVIDGATNRIYNVMVNATYRVIGTDTYGCADTSDPYRVNNVLVNRIDERTSVRVYPNPAGDHIYVTAPPGVHVEVYGMDGRMLLRKEQAGKTDIRTLVPGIYLLRVMDMQGRLLKTEKLRKE